MPLMFSQIAFCVATAPPSGPPSSVHAAAETQNTCPSPTVSAAPEPLLVQFNFQVVCASAPPAPSANPRAIQKLNVVFIAISFLERRSPSAGRSANALADRRRARPTSWSRCCRKVKFTRCRLRETVRRNGCTLIDVKTQSTRPVSKCRSDRSVSCSACGPGPTNFKQMYALRMI